MLVVRQWSLRTNRAALLCIFYRVSMLFCVCGFQAVAKYSNLGLTTYYRLPPLLLVWLDGVFV